MSVPSLSLARSHRIAVVLLAATIIGGWSSVASAHTDFESSDPADQQSVEGPLGTVTVSFTNPAVPSGEGFQLLDPSGVVLTPTSIDPTDGTAFVLRFDPPLGAGTYGVRWKVQAGDAHPIEGGFQFDVTEPTPPTTTAPAGAAPVVSTTAPPIGIAAADQSLGATSSSSIDEFLASDSSSDDAVPVGRAGRALTFTGTVFGLGALAALVWVIRGRRDELRSVIAWVRLAGLAIAAGGIVELAGLQAAQSVGIGELVDTKAGLAALLKVAGGAAVWFGFHARAGTIIAPQHSLSAAVAPDLRRYAHSVTTNESPNEHRWSPSASAGLGLAGYAIVLVSYWFDGHTVSKGPWAIHSLLNLVHVGAAAVWGGGVFAMTTVAWLRRRRSERAGMAAMVIRFSSLATVSLTAVIAAGVAMTVLILDTPGDLVGTDWGRILILKTLAVAVAAGLGAYNHFHLRPALEAAPDDPTLARELRTTLTIESAVFVVVVMLTAWLVAAAT